KKIIIIGALGMDFHIFNTVFKDNEEYEVIAFTIAGEQNNQSNPFHFLTFLLFLTALLLLFRNVLLLFL
ncbi:unnamed protein product, partial [marine sediment metagenome]